MGVSKAMGREAKIKKARAIRSTGEVQYQTANGIKDSARTVAILNKLGLIAPSQDVESKLIIKKLDIPDEFGGNESWK